MQSPPWWRSLHLQPCAEIQREKAVALFTQQTCWVTAKLPGKVLFFTQGSAGSGEPSRTRYKTFCCRTGDKQQLSVQTCHLAQGGKKLCARYPQLLLSSEHRAFMVSKQILDGSFHICGPETELRKSSLSHEQCLEALKKKSQQKIQSPPCSED